MLNAQDYLAEIEVRDNEVLDKLHKLKADKAAGPNGLYPRVLREVGKIIFKPLSSDGL